MEKPSGFTLIDALISLSIISILTGLAAPSFQKQKQKYEGEAAIAVAYHMFKFARQSAIRDQNRVYVCVTENGSVCTRRGSKSLIAFVDTNEDGLASTDEILKIEQLNYDQAFLHSRVAFGRPYLFFEPSGRTSWTGSIIYCSRDNPSAAYNKITWNRIGRVYKGVDLNRDGQIDDRIAPEQTCA